MAVDLKPVQKYMHAIETALAAGDATEHTHRPALKALIEGLSPGVVAEGVGTPRDLAMLPPVEQWSPRHAVALFQETGAVVCSMQAITVLGVPDM
ncbi:MAG: hypothetical protein HY673_06805 [Chloroflexi bacterium]|nr:hypothetical protein [Chloroflexota bacterium]